jgi:squalene synthase HpnC
VLARARGENFPVALRLLPARWRGDLLALYGFARLADELGDAYAGDRPAALDALEHELALAFEGRARHPLLRALEPVIRRHALPREPFAALIEANRRDQRVHRYESFDELRGYCALSADPVGRLVLCLDGVSTPENVALSDAICTALQLVEHLRDAAEDLERGRVYLPAEDLASFGCRERDLARTPSPFVVRRLAQFEAQRARALLRQGEPLLARLSGPARLAVAGFVAGGHAALDALDRAAYDLSRPARRPGRLGVARHAARLLWRARRPG